jgi:uncharacterized protein (DUF305 family)
MGSGARPGMGPNRGPGAGMMSQDADAHFIVMMIPHHQDAIDAADLALTQAERSEVKTLAQTIKRDQTRENEQMRAWYRAWFNTDAPARPQRGMGSMGGGMRMGDDVKKLDGAKPFDKAFLEMMVPHHEMAIHMATMMLPRMQRPEMKKLLQDILRTQASEIRQMRAWYRGWYGRDLPAAAQMPMGGQGMGRGMGPGGGPRHNEMHERMHRGGYTGTFSPNAPIRALSAEEIRQIRAGEGAGLARAAELNGLPGPRHVLELADELSLTPAQKARARNIWNRMRARAVPAGAWYLRAQENFERDLRLGRVGPREVTRRVSAVNQRLSALQAAHLAAHFEMRGALTPAQVRRYNELRGYAP